MLELAGVLAGPSAGVFFAELGAKVIKIENPKTKGDVTRSWKLPSEDPSAKESAYYWSVNTGKEVLFLDIAEKKDLDHFYELVKTADVLIANFKKGDDAKLKVSFDDLKPLNPQLIYASINGFGADSERTAYDLILQAEAGFMFINGAKDSEPVKMPVALIDVIAGHQLKEAILIALLKREKEKKGSHVSVSLFDSALASLVNQATNWLVAHHLPKAAGSLHPNIAPYGELFRTKDGQLMTFAIGSDRQFQHLCDVLNMPDVRNNPYYISNQERVKHRSELFSLMQNAIGKLEFGSLYADCLRHGIPAGKIRNLQEVFDLPGARAMLKKSVQNNETISAVKSIAFKFTD